MRGQFCVAWSSHNWIQDEPDRPGRSCSICGLPEPARLNRAVAVPRKPGRHTPSVEMAVDDLAQAKSCSKNDGGSHTVRPGRGYDFCADCGLVVRYPPTTQPPAEQPDYKVSRRTRSRRLMGLGFPAHGPDCREPSAKSIQRRRGKVLMIFARDGEGCFYCRSDLAVEDAVLDHFIPRSAGGADELENRRASCVACDKRKRDRMPWVFMPKRFAPPDPDAVGSPDPAIQRPLNPPELADGKSVDAAENAA